jgi:DUF1009 family protein
VSRKAATARYGMIAGNGRFPVLALESAHRLGHEVVVFALEEEASKEVERLAARCHWLSLGQLGTLIDLLKQERIKEVMMCGQVKHTKLFSDIVPDWRLVKLLATLAHKNTEALIGGVAKELAKEGVHLVDSTALLKPLLAPEGVLTERRPSRDELADIRYGRRVAEALAGFDIGQSVVVSGGACLAVEAMEGTDAMLRRAAGLANGRPIRLVKSSRGRGHLLFDVPVAGLSTIPVMRETRCTVLAVDAGRTLLLDRDKMIAAANESGLAIVGQ